MSMLSRLLKSLHHAVFDTSPDSGVAFFVRHPDGISWTVGDETLTATVNGASRTYALGQLTIGQLAGQLALDGLEVSSISPEFAGRSATVLLEGSGNTRNSNGDRLYAWRDLLRAILGGYARELLTAKEQIAEAVKQMVITQAEGEWLDLWGALYNTPRPESMADSQYQALIPKEAFRFRVNGLAIEQAIKDLLGQDVTIEEPWADLFRLDSSRLSSSKRFYDGNTIGYHLIQPVAYGPVVWDGVMEVIDRNRAAGVMVLQPTSRHRRWVRDPIAGNIWAQTWSDLAQWVKTANLPYLDNSLRLSNYEIDRNWLTAITSLQSLTSIPDKLAGVGYVSASHVLGYGPAVYPGDAVISPWHTGLYKPAKADAYKEGRRTWKDATTWRGEQSWRLAYSWRVFSAMTSLTTPISTGDGVSGSINSTAMTGIDWNGSWSDSTTWGTGSA